MAGGPDLFVVCKNCGSEVSPYITECPYCGARLRKRAPKLGGEPQAGPRQRPRLTPMRPGEIPGISADPTRRPYVTIAIVVLSLIGYPLVVLAVHPFWTPSAQFERLAYAPFTYVNLWYAFAVLLAIAIFGWRLELRHGALPVLVLFLLCGVGADALAMQLEPARWLLGAPGAALGMLAAWAIPDLLRQRRGIEHDGDLLGAAAIGLTVALMPLLVAEASAIATLSGLIAGSLIGAGLSRAEGAR